MNDTPLTIDVVRDFFVKVLAGDQAVLQRIAQTDSQLELLEQGDDVSASVLCPGPVATQLATTSAATTGSEIGQDVADYLARGLAPDDVGEMAIRQIEEGRFWLITHPELTHELMTGRLTALREGGRLFQPDTGWTDQ